VATGGAANWRSEVQRRRSPAHENKRRDYVILHRNAGFPAPKSENTPIKYPTQMPEEAKK
jgi:hypothetical protein